MNRHQVLTGAANSSDHSFAVGTVEGVPFTAYASGCNIVILASDFQRVQIIPGLIHGNVQVTCLDCSTDIGKIAASYGKKICIYEPSPLLNKNSSHHLDYQWIQTANLEADCYIKVLSWNIEGTKLLSGGDSIQLWHLTIEPPTAETTEDSSHNHKWDCVWKCKTAHPITILKFSPDGVLFASSGKTDRLVKVWYRTKNLNFTSQLNRSSNEILYTFIYLAHPRAVTGLSWRKTSKYMPRGSVMNMLVTSCRDNICRLWVQTLIPDDGLINIQQIDALSNTPKIQVQKNHKRIMLRLNHMKMQQQYKKRQATQYPNDAQNPEIIPTLPSTYSIHDFHNFGVHGSGIAPGMHFHLATSINAETGIPLVPRMDGPSSNLNFVIHWLNNKEITFTQAAEGLLKDLSEKVLLQGAAADLLGTDHESKESAVGAPKARPIVKGRKFRDSQMELKEEDTHSKHSISTASSSASLATEMSSQTQESLAIEAIDKKIEGFLREWKKSRDLLFSFHPVDGSYLVWMIEWLDEATPGSFNQAQVSFLSRIPNAIPLGDAATMSHHLLLYSPQAGLDLRTALKSMAHTESPTTNEPPPPHRPLLLQPTPVVCMISKHNNGSLNLWNLTFEDEKDEKPFTQVLSINHSTRVCGHRFRINDITCHPVLPLLLTTSHHNLPGTSSTNCCQTDEMGFCSELILWKVDPVGPLSKSGGITELARINSYKTAAFDNVAWIPTLLPSSSLGTISNSPSACFVASDGEKLRVYQAVIDARTLLAKVSSASRKKMEDGEIGSSSSSSGLDYQQNTFNAAFNIVSLQSTARPGCIIELESIAVYTAWHKTQLLQVFQEQLVTGYSSSRATCESGVELVSPSLQSIVDLRNVPDFEEPFYLVVMEKQDVGPSVIHTWRITISSQLSNETLDPSAFNYSHTENIVESESSSRSNSPEPFKPPSQSINEQNASPLKIKTTKVCTQQLSLPIDVEVVHAAPTAGHLSSSNIYPACFAPYLMCTACSDGSVRFWLCETKDLEDGEKEYMWVEWQMLLNNQSSAISMSGHPLYVSSAYSGRMACAFKHGHSFVRPSSNEPNSRFVNISVSIFECESTGGSEWVLEDTIQLKNVSLPRSDISLDLGVLEEQRKTQDNLMEHLSDLNVRRMLSVPSYTTLHSLRHIIATQGNQCLLAHKSLVLLDWVSTEDGSHVLTVTVGSKILIFTPVSTDIAQANVQAMKASKSSNRPLLKQASSMASPLLHAEEIRWMKIRITQLSTADGLPPLPMQISWVRDGVLVVGMDNEMQIFSQWRLPGDEPEVKEQDKDGDVRMLTEKELISRAQESSQLRIPGTMSRTASANTLMSAATSTDSIFKKSMPPAQKDAPKERRNDSLVGIGNLPDFGLFEASRFACPVLPQYHPKQLNELMSFGKLRRVKAILSHLVRCLAGTDNVKQTFLQVPDESKDSESEGGSRPWSRSRALSIAPTSSPMQASPQDNQGGSVSVFPEEIQLDYVEITSIPPLPLFTLMDADKETSFSHRTPLHETHSDDKKKENGYSDLFEDPAPYQEESLDDILTNKYSQSSERKRNPSALDHNKNLLTHFGPHQALLLTKLLTHSHLPGLSSLDQMHLLALADTVASFNTDLSDRLDTERPAPPKETTTSNFGGLSIQVNTDSLDDCGLRFLLALRHYTYLLRCLPIVQRAQLQKKGLGSQSVVWAFHSETQEELLQLVPCIQRGNPRWSELREVGVGWWVRSHTVLRRLIEKVAKAAFQLNNDPLDAAIFYLAMKKKNLVWGLFRSVNDTKMTAFFQNNFTQDKWRKSALKNAFALLGKQRFEHAAAFFLLAGSVKDAIEICLTKLEDIQLALVIVRCYEADIDTNVPTPNFKKLLNEEILGSDADGSNYTPSACHPDPFLRSMAFWFLQCSEDALTTLLESDVGNSHFTEVDNKNVAANPSVFNFYLYLRTHPLVARKQKVKLQQKDKSRPPLLGHMKKVSSLDMTSQALNQDSISPLERRLFFKTAHYHFRAGCPALALEVLSRLPNHVSMEQSIDSPDLAISVPSITIEDPRTLNKVDTNLDFDWGAPTTLKEPAFELKWDDDDKSSEEEDSGGLKMTATPSAEPPMELDLVQEEKTKLDIMAQQLKFVACLKIMMEELSTLATGFEINGGQLRHQLYIWLEKSVFALRELCNYSSGQSTCPQDGTDLMDKNESNSLEGRLKDSPHDLYLSNKMDFEAKLQRASRRKVWLKANEALLRTLFSYCSLHGAHGGGLATVRMELILLVQELQQELMSHQQLLSPLPFPTTLPLLAASVACQKTVVADPIRHLQATTHDILQSLISMKSVPLANSSHYSEVVVLRDLSTSLSACIYQSLCDGDKINSAGGDMAHFISSNVVYQNSHLLAGHARRPTRSGQDEPLAPSSPPNKWPGVQSLRALLARAQDEDYPKLHTLLCEAFVATYLSQLTHALATCDCHVLYRLVGQSWTESTWGLLFGGGARRPCHTPTSSISTPVVVEKEEDTGLLNSLSKSRRKIHLRLLSQLGQSTSQPPAKEDKPSYIEQFVPPEISMMSCFMAKPNLNPEWTNVDYDSSESVHSEDDEIDPEEGRLDDDVFGEDSKGGLAQKSKSNEAEISEQMDPSSYSWDILRYSIVKLATHLLKSFLIISGIDDHSPMIYASLKTLDLWMENLKKKMDNYEKPSSSYIPGCFVEPKINGPAILKYQTLLDTQNTPFKPNQASKPVRRLWNLLVRQEHVQDIFIRYIFSRRLPHLPPPGAEPGDPEVPDTHQDYVCILHKDQDNISAFCLNKQVNAVQNNLRLLALATPKEVQELDISTLMKPLPWLEDEAEFDILNLHKSPDQIPNSEFLVIHHGADKLVQPSAITTPTGTAPAVPQHSHRAATVVKRHKTDSVRKMCSHPLLPLYLTGSQDGAVKLWEWDRQHGSTPCVASPRQANTFSKVTRVLFSAHGNKFGVTDADGVLSLWQVETPISKPYFSAECHSKVASDFCFIGSTSFLATVGHSMENKNVCLWDTLLSERSRLVTAFACHDQGSSAILYAPYNQVLITAGKKGDVCIFDIRQRQQRFRFSAHDSAIKCLALDPSEEFFVTGSTDGDIKVWALKFHQQLHHFVGEHTKSSLFRNISNGVAQLDVDSEGRLFSCGADGSLKFRLLANKDSVVATY